MTTSLQNLDRDDARQMAGLARRISRARGRKHPDMQTVEVPLDLLNQLSVLASLYEGGTLPISQHLCQQCPLHITTVSTEQENG